MTERLDESHGFIAGFVQKVFDSVVKERNRALRAAQKKDPDFKRIVANLERNKKDLEDWAKKHRAEDPEFAEIEKDIRAIIFPKRR